jgi:hypothetical protein
MADQQNNILSPELNDTAHSVDVEQGFSTSEKPYSSASGIEGKDVSSGSDLNSDEVPSKIYLSGFQLHSITSA